MRARSGFTSIRPEEIVSLFGHAEFFRRALAQRDPLVLQHGETDEAAMDVLARARSSFAVIAPVRGRGEEVVAVLLCAPVEEESKHDLVAFAQAIALQLGLPRSRRKIGKVPTMNSRSIEVGGTRSG